MVIECDCVNNLVTIRIAVLIRSAVNIDVVYNVSLVVLHRVATNMKEGASLPPQDPLLKFMVESTTDDKAPCANCDTSVSRSDGHCVV